MKQVALQLGDGLFRPFCEEDKLAISEFKDNQIFHVELYGVGKPRSYEQLKLFWACCRTVADNTDDENWDTSEKVAEQIKIKLRYFDAMVIDGKLHLKTKSIGYKALPHMEACNLFDQAWPIMAKKIGISVEQLLAHTDNGIG